MTESIINSNLKLDSINTEGYYKDVLSALPIGTEGIENNTNFISPGCSNRQLKKLMKSIKLFKTDINMSVSEKLKFGIQKNEGDKLQLTLKGVSRETAAINAFILKDILDSYGIKCSILADSPFSSTTIECQNIKLYPLVPSTNRVITPKVKDTSYRVKGETEESDDKRTFNVYSAEDKKAIYNPYPYGADNMYGKAHIKIYSKDFKKDNNYMYIDCFLLQNVATASEEKYFTFQALSGETLTYFFGPKPIVYSFQGVVYNTKNQQWLNDFEFYYNNYLKGSASVKHKSKVVIAYNNIALEGFLLDLVVNQTSENVQGASLKFDMLLTNKTVLDYVDPVSRDQHGNSQFNAGVVKEEVPSLITIQGADKSKIHSNLNKEEAPKEEKPEEKEEIKIKPDYPWLNLPVGARPKSFLMDMNLKDSAQLYYMFNFETEVRIKSANKEARE